MKKCAARRRCGLRAEQRRSPLTLFSDHYQKDRKSTRLNSSHSQISYAVFCLKKKKNLLGNTRGVLLHLPSLLIPLSDVLLVGLRRCSLPPRRSHDAFLSGSPPLRCRERSHRR